MSMGKKSTAVMLVATMLAAVAITTSARAQDQKNDVFTDGIDAYIYGYPLVLMDVTRRFMTNVPAPTAGRAPINQLGHRKEFPTPESKGVVSPNADTLYSVAWLDLTHEPMVLHVPDTKGRYYVMQLLDAWTNVFAAPGKRTTGTGEGNFAIIGPGWKGDIPAGLTPIRSPTNMVWLLGRTQTNGPADFAAVHAAQQQYALTPLRAWGTPYTPPDAVSVDPGADTKTPPVKQVREMDANTFFKTLATLMASNAPGDADGPMVARLKRLGMVPGGDFDMERLGPATAKALRRAVQTARRRLAATPAIGGDIENGWRVDRNMGRYGTEYLRRALVASAALGANLPEDALYPYTEVDGDGRKLSGAHRYVLHFDKGQTPPTKAFWSLTMYNSDHFFVENPIGRYAIGDRDALAYNQDGSLDLLLQREAPGGRESNWLPAPAGPFNLILRIYWPRPEVMRGTWKPPAVQRLP
jgi:hypothetical protein